jgi:hypothetical protein
MRRAFWSGQKVCERYGASLPSFRERDNPSTYDRRCCSANAEFPSSAAPLQPRVPGSREAKKKHDGADLPPQWSVCRDPGAGLVHDE